MKTKKLGYALLCTVLLFTFSCEKEGPAGPAGPQGEQGEAGPRGPKGAKGTANVIYSQWLNVYFKKYFGWRASIKTNKLTEDIVNKGVVLVYFKEDGASNPVYKLDYHRAGNYLIHSVREGLIYLDADKDFSSPKYKFRYVLIPGGVLSPHMRVRELDSYEEVVQAFHISP